MVFDAKAWDRAQAEVAAKMLRDRIAALEAQLAALEAQLADRDAEIERLKHRGTRIGEKEMAAENDNLRAEIERMRADLVWAVKHNACLALPEEGLEYWQDPDNPYSVMAVDIDGTPDSIYRAVREARDGN